MPYTKKKRHKPLSDIEWQTCWMAIRYAINRKSIASACLPSDILKAYYHRFSDLQKKQIIEDIDREFNATYNKEKPNEQWDKMRYILDTSKHYKVLLKNGLMIDAVDIWGKIMPIVNNIIGSNINSYIFKDAIQFNFKLKE